MFWTLTTGNYSTLIDSHGMDGRALQGLCSEGYACPNGGRNYAFLTEMGLPKEFQRLMILAMMTPSDC